jgi:hypothetical protein
MDILAYTAGDLPHTRTYARRRFLWVPGSGPADPLGLLTLRLWKGRRLGGKVEEDTYQVEEADNLGHYPGRTFLLANTTDDRDADEYGVIYQCHLPARETDPAACTCKAGECRVPAGEGTLGCKHRDGLRHLIGEGII